MSVKIWLVTNDFLSREILGMINLSSYEWFFSEEILEMINFGSYK
jgi:hypothetical protein